MDGAVATDMYGRRETLLTSLLVSLITPEPTPTTTSHELSKCAKLDPIVFSSGMQPLFRTYFANGIPASSSDAVTLSPAAAKVFSSARINAFVPPSLAIASGRRLIAPDPPKTSFTDERCTFPHLQVSIFFSFPGVNPSVFFTVKYSTESRQSQVRNGAIIRRLCARRAKSSEIIRIVLPALPKSIRLWAVFTNNR